MFYNVASEYFFRLILHCENNVLWVGLGLAQTYGRLAKIGNVPRSKKKKNN